MNALFLRAPAVRVLSLAAACLFVAGVFGAATVDKPSVTRVVNADGPSQSSDPTDPGDVLDDLSLPEVTTTTAAATDSPSTTAAPRTSPSTAAPVPMTIHQPMTLQSGIYVTSTDGGPARRIVGGNIIGGYSFSPDGKQLAYSADNRIWIVPTAGGLARSVSPKWYLAGAVAWSTSGRYIAYLASETGQGFTLHLIDMTTGDETSLGPAMDGGGSSLQAAWHPKRDVLAYFSHPNLVVYDVATKTKSETHRVGGIPTMSWSASGDALAYREGNDLGITAFADATNFTGASSRTLATAYGALDPMWVGDQVFFVNPWKLDVAHRDGSGGRNVVSDYVGTVRYRSTRPNDLFVSIVPDTNRTELRQNNVAGE